MKRQRETVPQPNCRPAPATRSRLAMLGLATALLTLSACATLEEVEYKPLMETKFSARPEPAKPGNEAEDTLVKKGYAKIGTVRAKVPTERCDLDRKCQPVSGETDATVKILNKAAAEGGDLVVLSEHNVAGSEFTETQVCDSWTTTYVAGYQYICSPTGSCSNVYRDRIPQTVCAHWKPVITGSVVTRRSAGSVWRYEPELAQRQTLSLAVARGNLQVVRDALTAGQDPNGTDLHGDLPLHVAVTHGQVGVMKLLIQKGADVDRWYAGHTPMGRAIDANRVEAARLLLDKGADPNGGKSAFNPLWSAAGKGRVEIVKALLAGGANINHPGLDQSVLSVAVAFGHTEVVKTLVAKGADVNDKYMGSSVLHSAAGIGGKTEIARVLLAAGANPNITNDNGQTPLWSAAWLGHGEIVQLLLAHGADLSIKDKEGRTVLGFLIRIESPHKAIIEALRKAGATE